tara:strand:- start:218 stop:427 length:210 start_codon:yes stop_codon:yes gene_type:complete
MEKIDETKESNVEMDVKEVGDQTLTLEDIKSMMGIIDLCSQRGTFKPNEFKAVGEFYEKLSTFLQKKNV